MVTSWGGFAGVLSPETGAEELGFVVTALGVFVGFLGELGVFMVTSIRGE